MASRQSAPDQKSNPYLSPNQQDLLLAALNSRATKNPRANAAAGDTGLTNQPTSDPLRKRDSTTMSGTALQQSPTTMENINADYTPELDYFEGDASFDFDNADLGGEMIGALPGLDANGNPEQHDKRKSPDENASPEEGDAKRQELQEGEKGSKKPGRKPLTNEPTTVSPHFDALLAYHLSALSGFNSQAWLNVLCTDFTEHWRFGDSHHSAITDPHHRSAKHKIAPRSVHSESARRSI